MTLRLLALYLDAALASSRLRVLELAPALAAAGAVVRVASYPRSAGERREVRRLAREADVILVQKRLPSALEALGWRRWRRPVVFDFDDAIAVRQRPVRGSHRSRRREARLRHALRACRGAVVGNRHLALTSVPPGLPCLVAPTAVPLDVERHDHDAPRDGRPLRVGWVGGSGNFGELERVVGELARASAGRAVELCVVADREFRAEGLHVVNVPWTEGGQGAAIASFDLGLMPLADTPWNRGKGAYKLLQYMAAEVAAVASPVGMNAEVVVDGVNGRLAGDGEWQRVLGELLDDAAGRARLARAGRATVDPEHGFERTAERVLAFLAEVAEA